MKKTFRIIAMLFLLTTPAIGQQSEPQALALDRIKPLNELLKLAEQNLSSLRALNTAREIFMEKTKISKKNWMQFVFANAGVNYGNGVVYDELSSTDDQRLTYLSRQNVTYSVGLNVRLPFSAATNRKHEIKINQLEIEKIEGQKEEQKDLIRTEVIRFYNLLKNQLKALELKTEVIEANEIALEVSERYFKSGKLSVDQYRMSVDVNYTAKLEYEKAKNEAWYSIRMLRELVGEEINN